MSRWTRRTQVSVLGTTTAVANFPAPAVGALLVAFAASATTLTTPSGWALADSSVTTGAAYLWTKTAAGSETSLTTTLSPSGHPVNVVIYEFPPGTTLISTADQELASTGVASAGLTGMTADPKLLLHFGAFTSANNTDPAYGLSWDSAPANAITDSWIGLGGPGGSVASKLLAGYLEDSILTSWQPRNFLDGSGLVGTSNRITAAFAVPAALDSPNITNALAINPSTVGGSDGAMTLTWDPVDDADRYEVSLAPGLAAETGFVVQSADATSPYSITGLSAGPYTWGVRAYPAA